MLAIGMKSTTSPTPDSVRKRGDEDCGVRVVELLPGKGVDRWSSAQVSTVIIVQQRAEDTRRVEAGRAEPVDCAVGADECRRLEVADKTVIGDEWVARHLSSIHNVGI